MCALVRRLCRDDKAGTPEALFGAVVGHADTGFNWIVIDGQQRLTTISLLLLALSGVARKSWTRSGAT